MWLMHWNGGVPLYECKLRCIHTGLPLFPILIPLLPSCIHTMLIEGGCIIGRSTFREPLPSPSSALKPYREPRCPLSNRIVLHCLLHARLNTPPRLHLCLIIEFQLQKLNTASDFQLHILTNGSVTRLANGNVTRSTNVNLSSLTNGNIPSMTDANLTKLFVSGSHGSS